MKTFKNAAALVSYISPTLRLPGRKAFIPAIHQAQLLLANAPLDEIKVTKDVYPVVAKKIHHSLETTERAIYRAVVACWHDGKNDALHEIIGRVLPDKPKPAELIMYCAYYLVFHVPYHSAADDPALPMPF